MPNNGYIIYVDMLQLDIFAFLVYHLRDSSSDTSSTTI